MHLLPEHLRQSLIVNWELMIVAPEAEICPDLYPEVKLFTPNANAIWLLTELNPDTNVAFGLCDLGLGQPELGYVSLDELESLAATEGFEIEVDLQFDTHTPLSKYAELAKAAGRIEDW
jgi:hypothetical protein